MSWLITLLTSVPQLLTGLFGWLNKKEDTLVVEINNSATVSTEVVRNDTAHIAAVRDVTMAMLNHPVFTLTGVSTVVAGIASAWIKRA